MAAGSVRAAGLCWPACVRVHVGAAGVRCGVAWRGERGEVGMAPAQPLLECSLWAEDGAPRLAECVRVSGSARARTCVSAREWLVCTGVSLGRQRCAYVAVSVSFVRGSVRGC